MNKLSITFIALSFVIVGLAGCQSAQVLTEMGTAIAVATGDLTVEEAESINRSTASVTKAFEKLTPEQEYYIGRAVTAAILATYTPYDDPELNRYINTLGNALALHSNKPETFGGWSFLVMDTDEINAFAAPGGFILISRGMLDLCQNETELAAVLAHEIAHVELDHGLRAISKSRWTSAFTILGAESARNFGGEELAELTTVFEDSISDVTSTLVNSGYARSLEREADAAAIIILERVGYNPKGLVNMLKAMDQQLQNDHRGFAQTHPPPLSRVTDITKRFDEPLAALAEHPARQRRFEQAVAKR